MSDSKGNMVPLGALSSVSATVGPDVTYRYNGGAIQLLGGPASGYSSGQAADVMENLAASVLPSGYGYEWTGTAYQEKAAQGNEAWFSVWRSRSCFCAGGVVREWSIPFAVLLSVPLGMFGALFGTSWGGTTTCTSRSEW